MGSNSRLHDDHCPWANRFSWRFVDFIQCSLGVFVWDISDVRLVGFKANWVETLDTVVVRRGEGDSFKAP